MEVLAASVVTGHRDDDWRVVASVRSLAAELGLGKNAAHRALQVLGRAGLVVPAQRRGDAGRFDAGGYRLTIPPGILDLVDLGFIRFEAVDPSRESGEASKRRVSRSLQQVEQLVLLPAE